MPSAGNAEHHFYSIFTPHPQSFTRSLYERLYTLGIIVCSGLGHGSRICRIDYRLRRAKYRAHLFLRTAAELKMSWIYILSGIVALAILIYLFIALFYPEKF